jgi:hypothetical protein
VRTAPDAEPLVTSVEDEFVGTTRSAIDVAVTAMTVIAVVAALAGLLAVAQAVGRQVTPSPAHVEGLAAVGLDRRQRAAAVALPSVMAVGAGTVLAIGVAVALSRWFPIGVAADAEPDPGIAVDAFALAAVGAALFAFGVAVALAVGSRRVRDRSPAARGRVSPVVAAASRVGVGPVAALGLGLAYDRTPDRTATPSRTAIGGVVVGLIGLVAVIVLSVSLDTVRESPERWGWTWTTKPDNGGDLAAEDRRALLDEPGLAAIGVLHQTGVGWGDAFAQGFAVTPLEGETTLTIADGRAPSAPSEVALGAATQDDLGVGVGDEVSTDTTEGVVPLRVVGTAVLPLIDNPNPGEGAIFTPDGLAALGEEDGRQLLLTYEPGVDAAELEARLTERYDLLFPPGYARPQEPGRLANMADNRRLMLGLGGFFAALALAGVVHALVVSSRRQRHSFAVLRSLGLRRRQVRRTVGVQALAIVVAGTVVGVPLGIVVGRTAWLAAVGSLGMVDDPVTPATHLAGLVVVALVTVLLAAVVPAWRAAGRRPAQVLRSE